MKLKYIFTTILAALTLTSCVEDLERHLDEVQVSSSYVAIPAEGGSQTITVTATDAWSFSEVPEWLSISPSSGSAGEATVTFTADKATSTNEATVYLNCAGKSQLINVIQMTEKTETPMSTCAQVNSGEDGVTYRVKGTVTAITSTTYGNMYINDGTGEVYVYGTLDASGAEKNFSSLGISVGDIVTVEGPRKTYSGTIELVNVTVIAIEKSLISVDSVDPESAELPIEGGDFTVTLKCSGDGVTVSVPDAAKSWLSVKSVSASGKEAVVVLNAAANEGGDRETSIEFTTTSGGKEYSATTSLTQKGAIIETTVDQILAAEDGATQYKVTGYITTMKNTKYGNYYIKDATGELYVYGTLDASGASAKFADMGINEGDIVTVVGAKTSYNGEAQLKNVTVESHKAVTDITVADFVAKDDDSSVYYRIKGTVSGVKDTDSYGNIYVADETGSVYVYGIVAGWGGAKKQFQTLGIKDGDILTLVGNVGSYKGTKQVANAFFVAKEEAQEPTPDDNPYSIDLSYTLGENAYDDGVATINGVADQKVLKIGTSSKVGSITVTIPAGTKKVSFYAVAWKGNATTLTFSMAGTVVAEQAIAANDGATSNSPYTITVADSDKYSFDIPVDLTVDTDITISTKEGAKPRAIFFGLKK
jgi:DNA/RNA endonuclease YhcR with UshA esterase domain